MLTLAQETTAPQINPEYLSALHGLAQQEGCAVQTLVDQALSDLLAKHRQDTRHARFMAAYEESLERYDFLYKKLAE